MKLVYENRGELGFIILTNPPQNSLISPEFGNLDELVTFLKTPSFRGVIVKGAGRHFSSGADPASLKEQTESSDLGEKLKAGKELLDAISNSSVPTLAVIRGSCLGAGLEIALACHFRFASKNSLLGFPESDHGLLPGLGGTLRATSVMRTGRAVELLLSGKMVDGEQALELGIVDRVFSTGDLEEEAVKFLTLLVERRSNRVVRAVMTAINSGRSLPRDEALALETELFLELARSRDE